MKKLLIGCLIIVLIGAVGAAIAAYFAYRAASPYIQQATNYVSALKALPELDERLAIETAFEGPASGELTAGQVERFARVQQRVRNGLGARVGEIDRKHQRLRASEPSPAEALSLLSDMVGLFVDARGLQVDALNAEKFSQSEYDWVRQRVFAAAGLEIPADFDLRKIEAMVRSGQSQVGLSPTFEIQDVPEQNRELVRRHLADMDKWMPLAFFGL